MGSAGSQVRPALPASWVAAGAIPGSRHVPLPELRARLHELPRDRDFVVYCGSGQRSYYACRILVQNGLRARNLTGSWLTWQAATRGRHAP